MYPEFVVAYYLGFKTQRGVTFELNTLCTAYCTRCSYFQNIFETKSSALLLFLSVMRVF